MLSTHASKGETQNHVPFQCFRIDRDIFTCPSISSPVTRTNPSGAALPLSDSVGIRLCCRGKVPFLEPVGG